MARFGNFDQYLDNAGDPLVEGKLYFYESGTTTPKTTYSDVNNSIPNTNPVLLSAAGRQPNIFFDGVAKVILTDNNDVQIAVRDPVGETATDFGDEWVASKIYSSNDVVLGSDGIYYRSLTNGNQNNNPVTSTGYWTLLYSVEWNSGITYSTGDVVSYGSQQYQSLQNSNLNNNPASATSYWVSLAFAWLSTATYSEDQNVVGTDGILYTSLQNSNTGNDPATSPAYWVGTSAAAAASAVAAAASASAASASETAAAASETAAAASETAAAASESAAASSASAASTSASNAASSASAASTSEANAAASETAAAASASAASTSETNAAASASAASTSETNAAASETAAAASETAAAASESAAATSETNAANSASAASTSASNASTSATNAASSATAAAGSATAAAGSATSAATSATNAAASYDSFDDRYLGEKSSDPTVDNDGNPLITGALYFNNVSDEMKVYNGSAWQAVAPTATSITVSQISDYTGTATTLNYTSNLSSDAQTQLNSKLDYVAPSTAGNVLTSNGTIWQSAAPAGGISDNPLSIRSYVLPSSASIASSGMVLEMSATVDLIIIGSYFGTDTTGIQGIVYDSNTDTFGSLTTIRAGSSGNFRAFKIDSTTALIVSCDATTALEAVVVTLSGTSISVGTAATTTLPSNILGSSNYPGNCIVAGSTYIHGFGTASNGVGLIAYTVSGTTVTAGTPVYVVATGTNGPALPALIDSSNIIVTASTSTNSRLDVATYSVSGTTLTLINTASGTSARCTTGRITKPMLLSSGRYAAITSNATNKYGYIISLDGSNNPSVSEVDLGAIYGNNGVAATSVNVVSGSSVLTFGGSLLSGLANVLTDSSGTAVAGTVTKAGLNNAGTGGGLTTFNNAIYGSNTDSNNHVKLTINAGEVEVGFVENGNFDYAATSPAFASGGFTQPYLATASKLINPCNATDVNTRLITSILNSDDTVDLARGVLGMSGLIAYVHYDDTAKIDSKGWFFQSGTNNICKLEIS